MKIGPKIDLFPLCSCDEYAWTEIHVKQQTKITVVSDLMNV